MSDPGIGETAGEIIVHALHHALRDRAYLQDVVSMLELDDVPDSDTRWLYRQVLSVWNTHREIIPRVVLERRAARAKRDATEKEAIIKRVYDDAGEGYPRLALDELAHRIKTRRLHLALVDATDSIETDLGRAYEAIKRVAIQDSRPDRVEITDWFQQLDDRQREREEASRDTSAPRVIPIGIPAIDVVLDGGVARGELALVLGTTGRGKSMFLVNAGYNAAAIGFQVTHLTLEMSGMQVATRYDARWSKLDARRFKTFDFEGEHLDELDAKRRRAASKFNGKLNIASVPVDAADINTVRSILGMLDDRGVPKTDLLLVDSADHMKSLREFESYRHEQSSIYWNLKSLAQERGCAVVTSAHAGKEWADRLIKSEGVAESYDKARIADIIVSLNRSREDGREDVREHLDIFLAKYRDGEDNVIAPVRVHRPTMYFAEEDDVGSKPS